MFVYFYLLCSLATIVTAKQNCDNLGVLYYEELGCKATSYQSYCPASYYCPALKPKPNQCVYRGKIYNDGEALPDLAGNCLFCTCSNGTITCAMPRCRFPEIPEDCYVTRSFNECCPGVFCPNCTQTVTCFANNQTYRQEEFFTPEGTCWNCVCKRCYKGVPQKPACRRMGCQLDIWNEKEIKGKCAPAYPKTGPKCCPYEFVCPAAVVKSEVLVKNHASEGKTCSFGKNRYCLGDTLRISYQNGDVVKVASCSCKIPPALTCILD